MSDFLNLLIELSSPEDRAAYDNYRADLDSVNDYIEKKIAQSKEAFETASHPSFSKRIALFLVQPEENITEKILKIFAMNTTAGNF